MASVFRSVGLPLPTEMPIARETTRREFAGLLAQVMPFDLVIDEQTASGDEARVSKTSVCGSWGPIAGELRYFADRFGIPRASIEGTQIPIELIRRNAHRGEPVLTYDPERRKSPLVLQRQLEYFGFELERERHPVNDFPPELAERARHVIAESLAKFEARHPAVKRNRAAIEEVREVYRRSGGETPKLGLAELTALYEEQLATVSSLEEVRSAQLRLDLDALVPPDVRARYLALPGSVMVRDREVEIDYDVEERDGARRGVARLRLREKLARTLSEDELPVLAREVGIVVGRGRRRDV